MENWVELLLSMAKTVPSTKSCWVAFSGSNSLSSSVPSDLRKASTLAIWPAAAQLFGALGQRFVGTGLWSKNELEVTVAERTPRVGEVIVTVLPLMLTTPVKSSMSSSWEVPRLAFVRGNVKAVKTPGLGEEGLKLTDRVPPESEMALFRLKSISMPCLPLGVALNVKELIVGVPTAVRVAVQTNVSGHGTPFAVMGAPVSFRNVISGLERVT